MHERADLESWRSPVEPVLRATQSGDEYPFTRIEEFAENGESLEVVIPEIEQARPRPAESWVVARWAAFLPFKKVMPEFSLGEGMSPLVDAGSFLKKWAGLDNLLLKNETVNPTWSFKDRGSLTCAMMAASLGEPLTATISTGNMGQSMAAYGARAGIGVLVFLPDFTPKEKVLAMAVHGAAVIRVHGSDYAEMKTRVLGLANRLGLRIVSGNGPLRVEGYKVEAFELYEQLGGGVPDFVAVPTSACGHIRGIFKGFRELYAAGLIRTLPRMIVVQAAANSPLVTAIRTGRRTMVPFTNFTTVAEALSSGRPPGGDEIIAKAYEYGWLAADAAEEEILEAQRLFARAGFFVEPASATVLPALRSLRQSGALKKEDRVVAVLTGSGMKDSDVLARHSLRIVDCEAASLEEVAYALAKKEELCEN